MGLVVIESGTRPSNAAGPPPRGRKIHPFFSRSIPGRPPPSFSPLPRSISLPRRLAFSFLRPPPDTRRTPSPHTPRFSAASCRGGATAEHPQPDPRVRLNVFSPSLPPQGFVICLSSSWLSLFSLPSFFFPPLILSIGKKRLPEWDLIAGFRRKDRILFVFGISRAVPADYFALLFKGTSNFRNVTSYYGIKVIIIHPFFLSSKILRIYPRDRYKRRQKSKSRFPTDNRGHLKSEAISNTREQALILPLRGPREACQPASFLLDFLSQQRVQIP